MTALALTNIGVEERRTMRLLKEWQFLIGCYLKTFTGLQKFEGHQEE